LNWKPQADGRSVRVTPHLPLHITESNSTDATASANLKWSRPREQAQLRPLRLDSALEWDVRVSLRRDACPLCTYLRDPPGYWADLENCRKKLSFIHSARVGQISATTRSIILISTRLQLKSFFPVRSTQRPYAKFTAILTLDQLRRTAKERGVKEPLDGKKGPEVGGGLLEGLRTAFFCPIGENEILRE